jgi:PAS domain S-box-containing protein
VKGRARSTPTEFETQLGLTLLSSTGIYLVVLGADRQVHYANESLRQLCGKESESGSIDSWVESCVAPCDRAGFTEYLGRVLGGRPLETYAVTHRGPAGEARIEWRAAENEPPEVILIGRLVTVDDSALEMNWAARERFLSGTFESEQVALAFLDPQMRFIQVNQSYAALDDKKPEDFPGKEHFDLYPNEENQRIFEQVLKSGVPYTAVAKPFEYPDSPERGVSFWDWTVRTVADRKGVAAGLVLSLRDVTERIRAIEALRQREAHIARQLEEKEVLLRELHHRVRNNLEVMSSLLYLQAEHANDDRVRDFCEASQSRLYAMSLVHDTLYLTDDLSAVDTSAYFGQLVGSLRMTLANPEVLVETLVEANLADMSIEKAIPCGLITTELFSNCMKHAFIGRSEGRVWVSLALSGDDRAVLEVRDDGVGVPEECLENPESLGLQLVVALAGQLEGELSVAVEGGSSIRMSFPAGAESGA